MTQLDVWRTMCDLADMNALNIVTGRWSAEDEHQLRDAMALAGREATGLAGLQGVHEVRRGVLGPVEWKDVHDAAALHYAEIGRALLDRVDHLLVTTMAGGIDETDGVALAEAAITLLDEVGGYHYGRFIRLQDFFALLRDNGRHAGTRLVAWHMLQLERTFGRWTRVSRGPLLQWLARSATSLEEYDEVVVALTRQAEAALAGDNVHAVIQATEDQRLALDSPFPDELQAQVEARLSEDLLRGVARLLAASAFP